LTIAQLLKRPDTQLAEAARLAGGMDDLYGLVNLFTAETDIKYEGYIVRQKAQADTMQHLEHTVIDPDFNIGAIVAMRPEAREKLALMRPATLGQAGRISGVNPPDVALLSIHLRRWNVSRETVA
jgi:tRNA uridine 5-carboxymethylaminomethyl modification enzyme